MDNLYQKNPQGAQPHRGVINGKEGTWVPVEAETVPFPVSNDAANPSLASDGNYYYAQGGQPASNAGGGFGPIDANRYNAIPTPSSIVQMPPIVQPIALVPFASQAQPMLQYDPNYREEIQKTNLEPIYRAKPYAGLSVLCILFAVAACVIMCLLTCATPGSTALDSVFGLLALLGVSGITSSYYSGIMSKVFADGLSQGFSADFGTALMTFLVPVLYLVAVVCAVIAIIYYLVKLGATKSPRNFNVAVLIGLICSVANIIILFMMETTGPAAGAYVTAALFLVLLIIPFFAKKGAQIIDFSASRRLYGNDVQG